MSHIFIYPTDTVWGIGAPIDSAQLHREIAKIKGTKEKKPLSVLFHSYEQLIEYVDLPGFMSRDWCAHYFSMGASLALKKKHWKENWPSHVFADSDFFCFRILHIFDEQVGNIPISTTSLNKTGQPAMTTESEAMDFNQKYSLSHCRMIGQKMANVTPSGVSSTIICYENGNIQVWREGKNVDEIRNSF